MGDNIQMYYNQMQDKVNSSNDQSLKDNFKIAGDAATQDAFTAFWNYMWQSTLDMAK